MSTIAHRTAAAPARTLPLHGFPRGWLWAGGFAVWTVLALLSASQHAVSRMRFGDGAVDWERVLGYTLLDWYTCAVFTPAIVWLAGRFPLERGGWRRALPVHALASALFVPLKLALFLPLARALGWVERGTLLDFVYAEFFPLLLTYWIVAALAHGIRYYRELHERQLRASQLEARLSRVQLDALKAQLHPHFLFNALSALSTLMHRDVAAADRMVLRLSELLRHTLDRAAPQEVTLEEELGYVARYLDIMQIRLGERLRVSVEADREARAALVPNLLLQPLVENALRHGIGRLSDAGELAIRARRDDDALLLEVRDDGPGLDDGAPREGVGLRNTRLRLAQLYGPEHELTLANAPGRGAVVTVLLPFHTTEWAAAPQPEEAR
ncbi:MAG TPA: histidine kinase [Longimicrobium sp.]|jgi:signal transduction histidine kinase